VTRTAWSRSCQLISAATSGEAANTVIARAEGPTERTLEAALIARRVPAALAASPETTAELRARLESEGVKVPTAYHRRERPDPAAWEVGGCQLGKHLRLLAPPGRRY
jgi:hypothetical protein